MSIRLVIVQNILRDYNHWMFRDLAEITGMDVVVVFGDKRNGDHKFRSMTEVSIPHRRLPLQTLPAQETVVGCLKGLTKTLDELKPDVIWVEGESSFLNNEIVRRYCKRTGVPYVWWSLGNCPGMPTWNWRRHLIHFLCVRRQLSQASRIVTYSSFGADYYKQIGIPAEKLHVAVNVLSDRYWGPIRDLARPQVQSLRNALELDGKVSLLMIGSLVESKRCDEFIRFFELARNCVDLPPLVGLVVGDGPERAKLEAYAKSAELPIRFLGWRNGQEASALLLAADAFVSLGLGGLNISHALLHGMPILTAPADGTERDLVANGENGVLLSEGTAEALLAALRKLGGETVWTNMREASRKRHETCYNIMTWAHNVEAALCGALADAGRPTSTGDFVI